MISATELQKLKEKYPVGTVVVVDRMDDIQAVPPGTAGEVKMVDDAGNIHVAWTTGSSLALLSDVDSFHIKGPAE